MLSTLDLIELAKHKQGDVTDYRLSKLLGLKPQQISGYRNRGIGPSNPTAMRLGELAGIDPLKAVALVNLDRSTAPEDREVWEMMLSRLDHSRKRKQAA